MFYEEIPYIPLLFLMKFCSVFQFQSCTLKGMDAKEREEICNLNHKNFPKNIQLEKPFRCTKCSTAISMYVSSNCTDLLTYTLRERPELDERLHYYQQICDAVTHLHSKKIIIGIVRPKFIQVIDSKKDVRKTTFSFQ